MWNCPDFIILYVNSVYHGTKSITLLGPKVWDIVPEEIKGKVSLNSFKEFTKMFISMHCPCRLCAVFLNGVGLINTIKNNLPLNTCSISITTLMAF